MADRPLSVRISGYKEVSGYLSTVAQELKPQTVYALATFAVQVLKEEAPQNYVSRADAYGQVASDGAPAGFFSWAQFRYVMAKIHSGEITIPYARTHQLKDGWMVEGTGEQAKPVNRVPYARYVQGPTYQSRHERAVGWDKTTVAVRNKMSYILDETKKIIAGMIERTFSGRGPLE